MDTISLCLIARNEAEYLEEWLDYHILLGVDRFYIYDNESIIPIKEVIKTYIDTGWVHVFEIQGKSQQLFAYDHCLANYGERTQWMGFIDADEFLVLKENLDIKQFLERYEQFGGLAVSSLFFGSNGKKTKPKEGQIQAFTRRTLKTYYFNRFVKSIVQTEKVLFPDSPHGFTYKEGSICVNENGFHVASQTIPNSISKIQLNHYICRSQEDMTVKLVNGVGGAGRAYKKDRFEQIDRLSNEEDHAISTWLEAYFKYIDDGKIFKKIKNTTNEQELVCKKAMHVYAQKKTPSSCDPAKDQKITFRNGFLKFWNAINQLKDLRQRGELELYQALNDQMIQEYPNRTSSYAAFADFCMQFPDRYDQAWAYLWKGWQIQPMTFETMTAMVNYFVLIRDYQQVEKICHLMLKQGQDDIDTRFRLAWLYVNLNRMDEAVKFAYPIFFEFPVENKLPGKTLLEVLFLVAEYLLSNGEEVRAKVLLEKAREIFPGETKISKLLSN
ncbi:MAG: glycosyltransferase family 92 protein [Anaerolineaceae bacterium]|nr:glycosyltransferase family 92 protein [Anaerolineaceae bacterium]